MSSSKLAPSVEICEIEKRGALRRRVVSGVVDMLGPALSAEQAGSSHSAPGPARRRSCREEPSAQPLDGRSFQQLLRRPSSRSPRRGRGRARCSRRCARARRSASDGRGARRMGARGSSGRAPGSRSRGRRGAGSGSRPGGRPERGRRAARIDDSRFGMWRRESRLDSVGVALAEILRPGPVAGVDLARPHRPSPARAAPGAGSRAFPCPSGARLGSIVSGWPQTIVASAGRRPRSASLTARDTPSSPGVTWTIAVPPSRSSPVQRGGSESAKWICISERP